MRLTNERLFNRSPIRFNSNSPVQICLLTDGVQRWLPSQSHISAHNLAPPKKHLLKNHPAMIAMFIGNAIVILYTFLFWWRRIYAIYFADFASYHMIPKSTDSHHGPSSLGTTTKTTVRKTSDMESNHDNPLYMAIWRTNFPLPIWCTNLAG